MKPVPAIIFTLLIFLNAVSFASAAMNTVTSNADSGAGTLRQALANAADGDTIDFSLTMPSTILLTSGELVVSKNVTIAGPGPAILAVDGNAASRVFHIDPNAVVSISGLTITNGYKLFGPTNYGGGIYNDHGTLTVSNCTLSGNKAYRGGGIFNGSFPNGVAILRLASCRFSNNVTADNGAGVHNDGRYGNAQLEAINCIFAGNHCGDSGGGIGSAGAYGIATVAITNCTFNANYAPQAGGGVYSDGSYGNATLTVVNSTICSNSVNYYGGGIASWSFSGSASVTVLNSTLSGNTAGGNFGGGIVNQAGTLTVRNCSLVDNSASIGDNIWNGGSVHIGSSIMRGKAIEQNISSVGGGVLSDGFNLSSDASGSLTEPTDKINTDPMLGPLQDNGGPTFTHALLPGSPAIDAGKSFGPVPSVTDQRGRPRPFDLSYVVNAVGGDGSDIGAFELIPPVLNIAPSSTDVVLSWPSNDTGYQLESTPALPPAMWTPVPGTPAIAGDRFTVTNGPATASRFYRLKNL